MNTHPTFFLTLSISPTPSLSAISLFSSNHFLPSGLLFFLMQLPFIHLFLLSLSQSLHPPPYNLALCLYYFTMGYWFPLLTLKCFSLIHFLFCDRHRWNSAVCERLCLPPDPSSHFTQLFLHLHHKALKTQISEMLINLSYWHTELFYCIQIF